MDEDGTWVIPSEPLGSQESMRLIPTNDVVQLPCERAPDLATERSRELEQVVEIAVSEPARPEVFGPDRVNLVAELAQGVKRLVLRPRGARIRIGRNVGHEQDAHQLPARACIQRIHARSIHGRAAIARRR